MTTVHIGNASAIEAYVDPLSDQVMYRSVKGERVTSVRVPDSIPMQQKLGVVLVALERSMTATAKPHWIESDDSDLRGALCTHFSLSKRRRPARWGDGSTTSKEDEDE